MKIPLKYFLLISTMVLWGLPTMAGAQQCDPASPPGQAGSCQAANFPDCFVCQNGLCVPDDTSCNAISGGDQNNQCRLAVCTPLSAPSRANPSGCDYDPDPSAGSTCFQCNDATAPFANHCPNAACEPGLGETPTTCPIDCLVPGITPFPTQADQDNACAPAGITFMTFNGPPFNVPGSGECEDGNVCTADSCTVNNTCSHTDLVCNNALPDLCCPSGCGAVPLGATDCRDAFDKGLITQADLATCDSDCRAIPCPTPSPTPIPSPTPPPPIFGNCVEGSGINGNNGNLNCKGFTCSLNPSAASKSASGLGLVSLGALLLTLAWRRKRFD